MKKLLSSSVWGKKALWAVERIVFGGRLTEAVLLRLLGMHYRSVFRRDWAWSPEQPHFFNHRIGFFDFIYGNSGSSVFPYYRGFFVSELIKDNDRLLDIGCGDGFFTKRFYSRRCSHIDAIDIEPTAIAAATSQNASPKTEYSLVPSRWALRGTITYSFSNRSRIWIGFFRSISLFGLTE